MERFNGLKLFLKTKTGESAENVTHAKPIRRVIHLVEHPSFLYRAASEMNSRRACYSNWQTLPCIIFMYSEWISNGWINNLFQEFSELSGVRRINSMKFLVLNQVRGIMTPKCTVSPLLLIETTLVRAVP